MRFGLIGSQDVDYLYASDLQKIRNQSTMAAPPNRLGAHDCCWPDSVGQFQQSFDTVLKGRRLHVIGISAKRVVAPGGISRVRTRFASPAQLREMFVFNVSFALPRGALKLFFIFLLDERGEPT